jgi:hypothetical protein
MANPTTKSELLLEAYLASHGYGGRASSSTARSRGASRTHPHPPTFDALELERLHGAARLRDDLEAMRADVRERGLVVDSPKGPIPNPMILRIESAEKAIAVLLSKLKLVRPEPTTGHLSRAQRNRLRDLNARGYG